MSTLVTGTIKSNTANPPLFQNTSGTEIGTLCRAWVNFNGTGTVAIRAQFNVSSITDNGTGDYTVNFATALADANYCVVLGMRNNSDGLGLTASTFGDQSTQGNKSTSSIRVRWFNSTFSPADNGECSVSIFR
jgi:hypothetical protein